MTLSLPIQYHYSLRALNTFGVEANAYAYLPVDKVETLRQVRYVPELQHLPRFILGGGSNILLTRDFPGLVLHIQNKGISVIGEDNEAVYIRVAAGENWHDFVQWTLQHGFLGLENLSLIPGSVGAAPVQNIGAYGAEIKDVLHSLRAYDFIEDDTITLNNSECEFGYRDSIFKHRLHDKAVILEVTFALPKAWKANIRYADVQQELDLRGIVDPTAVDISNVVIAIRTRKLPNPAEIGNAGSFFKNPILSEERRNALLSKYANFASYSQPDGTFKVAAGWLIDQCGWKGKSIGHAGVYEKQALVLVNQGGATGKEIAELALAIQRDVQSQFGIQLEPEPIFL
jgi:UDP-N-acetylmuramate dehydrogenase